MGKFLGTLLLVAAVLAMPSGSWAECPAKTQASVLQQASLESPAGEGTLSEIFGQSPENMTHVVKWWGWGYCTLTCATCYQPEFGAHNCPDTRWGEPQHCVSYCP